LTSDLKDRFQRSLAMLLDDAGAARLGIAVSGGGDSMALLRLAPSGAMAATVDHHLRPQSAAEAARVADWCATLGVTHDTLFWDHGGITGNLPAEARAARYALLADWAMRRGLTHVLVGHTEDDLAETLLMRLGREAGLSGLAAMRERWNDHGVTFLRPLLGFSRAELRTYLTGLGQDWIDDPTNDDASYQRVRVRQALATLAPLGITREGLARSARYLAEARDALAARLCEAAAPLLVSNDPLAFDWNGLAALNPEIRRRLLAAALVHVGGGPYPPRRKPLAELYARLEKGVTKGELGRCWIRRDDQFLKIAPQRPDARPPASDFLTFLSTH
jgi:tRNA(Ile)-lysidine synthase